MYSRILRVIIILAYIFSISACGWFGAKTKLGPVNSTTEQYGDISNDSGVTSKNLNSSSAEDQTIAATSSSDIAGSSASFAPGSLSIDTTISMENGVSLSENNLLPSELGLSGDTSISAQGNPVAVTASNDVNLTLPMTLSIPLPDSAGLKLTEEQLDYLIVIFRIKIFGIVYSGVIPRSFLTINSKMVDFKYSYFGVFQTVFTKILFTKSVEVKSNYKNITKKEHESNPEPIVNVPPPVAKIASVAFTSPNPSSLIDDSNKSSFDISGTCSEEGESVQLSGAMNYSATCTSASWSVNLDLSALPDGNVSFAANHTSSNATAAPEATITFTKSTSPSVINVTSAKPDDYYPSGTSIDITVQFSSSVDVVGGSPTLALNNGGTATYTTGSGSDTLTFNYVSSGGEETTDLDYSSTSALSLASATIKDDSGVGAALTLNSPGSPGSLAANNMIFIDTTPPAVATTLITPADAAGNGDANWDNDSSVFFAWTAPSDGAGSGVQKYTVHRYNQSACAGGSTDVGNIAATNYEFTSAVHATTYSFKITAHDHAGNDSVTSCSTDISIDTVSPTAATTLKTPADSSGGVDAAYDNDLDVFFKWTAGNDALSGVSTYSLYRYDLPNCGGSISSSTPGLSNATLFQAFSGSSNTTYSFKLKTYDAAGNYALSLCSTNITLDNTAPTSVTTSNPPAYSTTSAVSFAWTGGTDTNFDTFNIKACTAGDCSTGCLAYQTDAASPYTFTGLANGTTYYGCVQAVDLAGNSTSYDASSSTVIIDTTDPSPVTTNDPISTSNSTTVSFSWSGGTDTNFDTFNVKACTSNDCSTGCTSPQTDPVSPNSFSGLVDGTSYYVCVQALDLAGNVSAYYASTNTVTIDTAIPSILSIDSPVSGDGYYKLGETIDIDVNFSEAVTLTGTASTLTLSVGTAVYQTKPDADTITYRYTVGAGHNHGDLDVTAFNLSTDTIEDSSSNGANTALPANNLAFYQAIVIDTTSPTAVVTTDSTTPSTAPVATGWTGGADTNSTLFNIRACTNVDCVTGCRSVETDAATPYNYTDVVDAGVYYVCVQAVDLAGNTSAYDASTNTVTIDTTSPAISSMDSPITGDGYYKTGDTIDIDVNFSETVTLTGTASTLTLSVGTAIYQATADGDTIRYRYTVSGGHNHADLNVTAFNINTDTIKDAAANSANTSLPGSNLANNQAIVIDTTSPAPVTTSDPGATSAIPVSTAWSGGTDTNSANFEIKACTNSGCSSGCRTTETSASSPHGYTDVVDSTLYYMCVRAFDLAGNTTAWDDSPAVTIDNNPAPITCDSGDLATTCTISTQQDIGTSGETITGAGNLVITGAGWIKVTASPYVLNINMTGDVTIQSGGLIEGNVSITATNLTLNSSSQITAAGLGHIKSVGTGAGTSSSGNGGGGGSHGGAGGDGSGNPGSGGSTYGSSTGPITYGSGGGAGQTGTSPRYGGSGGGAIKIVTTGNLTLDGSILADGLDSAGSSGGGGGGGGSIWIDTDTVSVSGGSVSAKGGDANGTGPCGGGGGGGRVDITANDKFSAPVSISGGTLCATSSNGSAGTFEKNYLFCDTGDLATTCTLSSPTIVNPGEVITPNNLTITTGGNLYVSDPTAGFELDVGGTFTVASGATWNPGAGGNELKMFNLTKFRATTFQVDGTVIGNFNNAYMGTLTVSVTGLIQADSLGEPGSASWSTPGSGSAPGTSNNSGTSGGGGGHGGAGGDASGSTGGLAGTDDPILPADFGSGGGANPWANGGSGGGYMKLVVIGTLTNNGAISANGESTSNTSYPSGGGAGGTVWLDASTVAGSGVVRANGGDSPGSGAGGGGGGIIVVYYHTTSQTWATQTLGGTSSGNSGSNGLYSTQLFGTNYNKIFATSATYSADFASGLNATANGACIASASAAGLLGNYVALISASSHANTVTAAGTYNFMNPIGELVATDSTLFSGAFTNAIRFNEYGDNAAGPIWTGSQTTGNADASNNCSSFNSTAGTARVGDASAVNSTAIDTTTPIACSGSYSVYCVSTGL